jgi:hypothetical protein
MKRGIAVAVCHDGKWGRRVKGVVIGTRKGSFIKVRFPHPADDTPVEAWFRVIPTIHHRQVKRSRWGATITGKNYKHFGGWVDIQWFCPWFAVYKWPRKDEE